MSLLRRLARQVFAHRHTRCDFASATRESMRHQLVGPGTEIRRQDSEEVWPNRARAGAMAAPRPVALSPRLSVLYQLGMTKERNTELSICWGMGGPSRLGMAALRGSVLNASRPSERRKGRADEPEAKYCGRHSNRPSLEGDRRCRFFSRPERAPAVRREVVGRLREEKAAGPAAVRTAMGFAGRGR